MAFFFRRGSGFAGDAKVILDELEAIRVRQNGHLTPQGVVDHARMGGPLNPLFEWNDAIAADKYRLHTARRLIRAVYIEINGGSSVDAVPVFIHVRDQDEPYYQNISVATKAEFDMALDGIKKKITELQKSVFEIQAISKTAQQKRTAAKLKQHTTTFVQNVNKVLPKGKKK